MKTVKTILIIGAFVLLITFAWKKLKPGIKITELDTINKFVKFNAQFLWHRKNDISATYPNFTPTIELSKNFVVNVGYDIGNESLQNSDNGIMYIFITDIRSGVILNQTMINFNTGIISEVKTANGEKILDTIIAQKMNKPNPTLAERNLQAARSQRAISSQQNFREYTTHPK